MVVPNQTIPQYIREISPPPTNVLLLTVLQNLLSIGAINNSPIYEAINQFEDVIKKTSFIPTCSPQLYRIATLIIIQKRQIKARLISDVFLGVAEKYPVISINTFTPIIEKASSNNAPKFILTPNDCLVVCTNITRSIDANRHSSIFESLSFAISNSLLFTSFDPDSFLFLYARS